ncbi:MAG: hypothetical protein RLZZ234_363 [Candidatus Parcubacteria bacterium]|jgi:hypothetical protein
MHDLSRIDFEDALRTLTDDYAPPGLPYLTRAPIPKTWIITVPGARYEISEDTFRELLGTHCIVADKEHFVPTAYAKEFVQTL